ncbi:MAG: CCA tRNA nucleotidyltransferase [Alphaproteobacteria bacterium]
MLRLDPQPWMDSPEASRLIAALSRNGADVRFVGGCVRDALIGRAVSDVDVATPDPPETVMRLLEAAAIRAVPTGLAHGTVTAVVEGHPYEVTTLRRDLETFGRHARVAFTDDWQADAARRDFTMNAMSCRPDGLLFDPFGGAADLFAGRVRFVGDARGRIAEDILRLLRFFRFFAWYGTPPVDAEGLAACREAAHLLPTLSAERVRRELLRLLAAPDPLPALRLMVETGVLREVLPEARGLERLAALVALERVTGEADAVRRLAAFCVDLCGGVRARPNPGGPDAIDAIDAMARRLRLSNAERKRIVAMSEAADREEVGREDPGREELGDDLPAMRRALHRLGVQAYRDRAFLAAAAAPDRDLPVFWRRLAAAADWTPARLPVGGRDLAALGISRGPEVGRALAALEAWWVAEDFRPDRAACIERLRAMGFPAGAVRG